MKREKNLAKRQSEWQSEKNKLENDLRILQKQLASSNESREKSNQGQSEFTGRIEGLEAANQLLTEEVDLLKSELELAQAVIPRDDQVSESNEEWEKLRLQAQELQVIRLEREELATKLRELELNHVDAEARDAEYRTLEAERNGLLEQLQEAESRAEAAEVKLTQQAALEEDPEKIDELQKRLEMAIEDVRSLKRKNMELETQLINLRQNGSADNSSSATGGWESMKPQDA